MAMDIYGYVVCRKLNMDDLFLAFRHNNLQTNDPTKYYIAFDSDESGTGFDWRQSALDPEWFSSDPDLDPTIKTTPTKEMANVKCTLGLPEDFYSIWKEMCL